MRVRLGMAGGWGSLLLAVATVGILASPVQAQIVGEAPSAGSAATSANRPLPDVETLMHDVERHQREAEAIEKNYLYRSVVTSEEVDGRGGVKKTEVREFEVFWQNGVPVRRLVKKNGRELSADEARKEAERVDRGAERAKERRDKGDEAGKETDARGHDVVTVSRLLELGRFTGERRLQVHGRDTIALDYEGDPKAKTRNRMEEVIRVLVGTVWVDERDRAAVRIEGRFLRPFKVGGGLVASVAEGTHFEAEQAKVNGEVWLPSRIDAQGSARALLVFSFNGRVRVVDSDYRKFKATSTILPGVGKVEEGGAGSGAGSGTGEAGCPAGAGEAACGPGK